MPRKAIGRVLGTLAVGLTATLALSACSSKELKQGYLPGSPDTTDQWNMIAGLWTTSWIILLVIGVIVWGLTIFAVIAFRRRKGETGYPVQLRYNMPLEILYTIVPFILIIGFYWVTAHDQASIPAQASATDSKVLKVQAIAEQWTWQFNYTSNDAHERPGVMGIGVGKKDFDESTLPTLYLPAGQRVEVKLTSRDVDHSFWVPAFLYKKDTIPGHTNYWTFTPQKEGTYRGKCAELCGEYHSLMLFNVKVVSPEQFQNHIADLKKQGFTGVLSDELNRNANLPGNKPATTGNE